MINLSFLEIYVATERALHIYYNDGRQLPTLSLHNLTLSQRKKLKGLEAKILSVDKQTALNMRVDQIDPDVNGGCGYVFNGTLSRHEIVRLTAFAYRIYHLVDENTDAQTILREFDEHVLKLTFSNSRRVKPAHDHLLEVYDRIIKA